MSRSHWLVALFALASGQAALAQEWQVVRAINGAPVARVETGDAAVPAIELACDGSVLAVSVHARAAASVRLVSVAFAGTDPRVVNATLLRLGNTPSFVGQLPDFTLAEGLTGAWNALAIGVNERRLGMGLQGASEVVTQALAACYQPAAARLAQGAPAVQPANATGDLFDDASLPSVLRDDLADFAHLCDFDSDVEEPWNLIKAGAGRGPPLAGPTALQRADFNGDGVDDYVLDTTQLRCTRRMRDEYWLARARLMVYTSNGGDFVHSLDVFHDSWRLVPATAERPAGIFAHRGFVPMDASAPEGEGDAVPQLDETIAMTGPTNWTRSELGQPDWRLGELAAYPAAVAEQFARWDSDCRAVGRRLDFDRETYGAGTINEAGDLNRDGVTDYVLDVVGLHCGVFGVPPDPRPPYFCGSDCMLIAIVSAPGGTHVADRIEGSITFEGNGDPASVYDGAIYWPTFQDENTCMVMRVSYAGTRQQRSTVTCSEAFAD